MPKTILSWIGITLAGVGYLQSAMQEPSSPVTPPVSQYRTVLNRYCVTCHNEKLRTAGLTLDKMDVENPSEGAETWEKVVRKLRAGAMPPAGMRQRERCHGREAVEGRGGSERCPMDRRNAAHDVCAHRQRGSGEIAAGPRSEREC